MNDAIHTVHGGAQRLPLQWPNCATPPMRIARYRVAAGDIVSPHVHTGKIEYWLVVRGVGLARIGDTELAVREGDVVATQPSVPHSLRNTGAEPLEFVNFVEPTGERITTTELDE